MKITQIFLQATSSNTLDNVTIWSIIVTIPAIISAYSAFKSRGFAKRSYELSMRNYNDRQANFGLYLIDAYRWVSTNEQKRKFLMFHITVFNKSDGRNSFKADLEIEYLQSDNLVARITIPHNEKHHSEILQNGISSFPNDIRIEEKGMQSKWLLFEQPINAFKDYRIERYTVKISDTLGNIRTVDSSIIKELSNEGENS